MAIEGLPGSSQKEAFGGAGGILSTGFDKKIAKETDTDIVLSPKAQFQNKLFELFAPEIAAEVNVKKEKTEDEKELLYHEQLLKIVTDKANSLIKKKEEKKRDKKEEGTSGEEARTRLGRSILLPTEVYTSATERIRKIEETLLKDYIALSTRIMTSPSGDTSGAVVRLGQIKDELREKGLLEPDFLYLDFKTQELLKLSSLDLIRDKFYKSNSLEMIEWLINAKSGRSIIDFLNALESDALSLSERADILRKIELSEFLNLASALKVDLAGWLTGLDSSSIKVTPDRNDIFFHVFDQPHVEEISKKVNAYRSAYSEYLLEDNLWKKFGMYFDMRRSERALYGFGVDRTAIREIKAQSRKISWIRTITRLKELHLNRILTTSSNEFDIDSVQIARFTLKAKRLGYDIPKEGVRWIETRLETLALESAEYKLELLKSLQTIAPDPKRNRDISRLASIIVSLRKKVRKTL